MPQARRLAYLFPGQGSQVVGMGKELAGNYPAARQVFAEADKALGYSISELCFHGPEDKLKLTEITQPAILTTSIAGLRVLRENGLKPTFVAGHSLGEYSAHVAAGTLGLSDAVKIVRNRGKYMQEAVPVGVGAMAAILGLALEKLQEVCNQAAQGEIVTPANINSPTQMVISGHASAVGRAADLAKARGALRTIMLPVSAPFHCALMQPAQERLEKDLQSLEFHDPRVPVINNVEGAKMTDAAAARDALIRQVTGAVEWVKVIEKLIGEGTEIFVEVGPGKVLTGLLRQIDRSRPCLNVDDERSLRKTLQELAN